MPVAERMQRWMTTLLVVCACVALAGCGGSRDVRVVKLAHGLPTRHPVHEAMVFMSERAADLSQGALVIDIHPNEQLGTEREAVELLQIGSIGMTKVSASVLESFVPDYAVFNLPYLFRDDAHKEQVLTGEVGSEILRTGQPYGVLGLVYYDAGSRSFYTKERPIHSPADLAGLKIRTQESPSAIRMVRALGGSATPIAWGELYTALQQGVVDGAENNPPSFHLSRHYEVCSYYSLDEHTSVPDVLLVSTHLWNALSADERRILERAAKESADLQRELWRRATADAMRAVEEAGVEIIRPDKAAFSDAVAEIYEELRSDPELYALAQKIRGEPR
jgi:tripartite ATP-independent transporter DctP family solute receptor